jgi:hypothetical protein
MSSPEEGEVLIEEGEILSDGEVSEVQKGKHFD